MAPDPYLEKWIAENPGKPIPGQDDSSDESDSVSRTPTSPGNGEDNSAGGSAGDPNIRSPADEADTLNAGIIAVIIICALAVVSSGAFVVHRRRQAKRRHAVIDAPVEDTPVRYEVKSETKPLSSIAPAVSLPPPPDESPAEVISAEKTKSVENSSVSPTHSSPILKQDSIVDNELMREDFMSSHVHTQSVETTNMTRETEDENQEDHLEQQPDEEEEAAEFEPINTQELSSSPPPHELNNDQDISGNDNGVRDSLMITAEEAAVALAGYNQVEDDYGDDDDDFYEEKVKVKTPSPIDNIVNESSLENTQRESSLFETQKEDENLNSPSYFRDSLVTEISESSELDDSLEGAVPVTEEEANDTS